MITLPDLPKGYRWKYGMQKYQSTPTLMLQYKQFLWWKSLDYEYIRPEYYQDEQAALDDKATMLMLKLSKGKPNPNFGTYYGSGESAL